MPTLVLLASHERGNVPGLWCSTKRYQWERQMNLRLIFAACTIAAFGSSMMTFDALSQKQSLKEQLVGTWTLLSWEQKKGDGGKGRALWGQPEGHRLL